MQIRCENGTETDRTIYNFRNVISRKIEFSEKAECAETIVFTVQNAYRLGCVYLESDQELEKNPHRNSAPKYDATNSKKHETWGLKVSQNPFKIHVKINTKKMIDFR